MPTSSSSTSTSSYPQLIAWLENTRVELPLKGVECRFTVAAGLATVELDQIFHQNQTGAIDCTYSFPLPGDAAVYRCEMMVNGRIIRAIVEEKAAAQKIHDQAKAAGHRAALVNVERDNLFTLTLSNVQPGDLVVVRFSFFQPIARLGLESSLRIPLTPGVRYIPGSPLLRSNRGRGTVDDTDQVPDASRITPPRIDQLHPDAAYFHLEGKLSLDETNGAEIASPSHPLSISAENEFQVLRLAKCDHVPDRDIVLRWTDSAKSRPVTRAFAVDHGTDRYVMLEINGPTDRDAAPLPPIDFYLLVDRSGSMSGGKWEACFKGVNAFLSLLREDDRLDLTFFNDQAESFAEAPLSASAVARDPAFLRLADRQPDGGTEILPALTRVYARIQKHTTKGSGRSARIAIITDGQVGNESAVVDLAEKHAKIPIEAIGIDTAVNDAFLQNLARITQGHCTLLHPEDDIVGSIQRLAFRFRAAVFTALAIEGNVDAARPLPTELRPQETVRVALKVEPSLTRLSLHVRTSNREDQWLDTPLLAGDFDAARLLWAKDRIVACLDREDRPEAIRIAKAHNVLCDGTAFVAWDETEKVVVAQDTIAQPSMEPFFAGGAAPGAPVPAPAQAQYRRSRGGAALKRSVETLGEAFFSDYRVSPLHAEETAFDLLETSGPLEKALKILRKLNFPESTLMKFQIWFSTLKTDQQSHFAQALTRRFYHLTTEQKQKAGPGGLEAFVLSVFEETFPDVATRQLATESLRDALK